ncbi:MAG: DUF3754 domain-containing protein [Hyphomonadaceae bacterium]|nr:DUF3754 domain-containing protein [Hyphomonadaceae bacterium]
MADSATNASTADGYIAARKSELAAALTRACGDGSSALGDVFRLLDALLHHQAHTRLEQLKALYDPLDPDAPAPRRDVSPAAFEAFEGALVEALQRANFTEIEADNVQTLAATKQLTGLAIKPSHDGIRRVRFFARGIRPERVVVRELFGLRQRGVDTEMMSDVVVLVGFKGDEELSRDDRKAFARMRRGVRPGAALVKHFRNVASPELVTLHPGARPSMLRRDQVFIAAPAVAAGVPVALNLWPALTVLFAVLAAYFGARGAIEESDLKRALAAVSGLVAVGAFVMRQRLKYEAQTLRYQKQLADTVYFRNIANNTGVIDLLIGAGEDQDAKEAMVAYALLAKSDHPMGKGELDMAAEDFIRTQLGLDLNFEIGDALAKLERLNLVRSVDGNYSAVPPREALTLLDAAWDNVFNFSARR